ncbi:hypothetical protein G6F31_014200 [Rhizopus arrhizus]|nr:hypothetical protein G6F31_014200 [Rhizopus arrhizus]
MHAVDAHAPFAVVAEAAAQVPPGTELRVAHVVSGHARQVLRQRALGHHVDHPAHPAVGRHAVQQGCRPLQHFNALDVIGEDVIVGRHAVDAVERDLAQVAFTDGESTDVEGVRHAADLAREAHRGLGIQRVRHGDGLAGGQQRRGVARDVERRIHHVAIAQQPQAAAAGHLAAGEFGRQSRRADARPGDRDAGQQRRGLALALRQLAQGIGARPLFGQGITRSAQQARKPFAHRVGARQAFALPARHQRRIERQRHPRRRRELGQHVAQRAAGDRVGLARGRRTWACGIGSGGRPGRPRHGQQHQPHAGGLQQRCQRRQDGLAAGQAGLGDARMSRRFTRRAGRDRDPERRHPADPHGQGLFQQAQAAVGIGQREGARNP